MELNYGQIKQLSGPLLVADVITALRQPFDEYTGTWQDVVDLVKVEFGLSDADLEILIGFASLTPTNDDVLQFKAGSWANRTMAQLKTDLVLVKGDVGLGNVDNTSDVNKPVSTAQQAAIDAVGATWIDCSGTSTFTGWVSRSVTVLRYNIVGKIATVVFNLVGVTTTANTTASFTLPFTSAAWGDVNVAIKTITATTTAFGNCNIVAGASTVNLYPTAANGNWQSSAGVVKTAYGVIQIPLP